MRVFAALFWCEVFERRLLLLASAFLGLVPIVIPWLPDSPQRYSPQDLRTVTLMTLIILFGSATLLILGSTIVGRDSSEGRLGFFFSRPISSRTLWLSRIAAATFLLLASLFLLAAPTLVLDHDDWIEEVSNRGGERAWPLLGFDQAFSNNIWTTFPELPSLPARAGLALLVLISLLAATHAISTVIRSRSAWVFADLAGLVVVLAIGRAARDSMMREEALKALIWTEWLLIPWILGCLLLAGAAQIERGRTDPALGHRWLSAVLWPTLTIGALAFLGYSHFIATSAIEDLENLTLTRPSPNDKWLVAGGPVRHRAGAEAGFLLDTRSQQSWRLGTVGMLRVWLAYSADSSTLAWIRCRNLATRDCNVWTKNLEDPPSSPRSTDIPIDAMPQQIVLSAAGHRLAVVEAKRIAVYDVASGNLLAAASARTNTVAFLSADRLRFHEIVEEDGDNAWRTRIRQLDIGSRQLTETGSLPTMHWSLLSSDTSRLLYGYASNAVFGLFDSTTGEQLRLFENLRRAVSKGHFLPDGRLVAAIRGRSDHTVTFVVLSQEGEEEHQVQRDNVTAVRFGGELAPGRVIVGLKELNHESAIVASHWPETQPLSGWATYVLDTRTATLEPLAVGGIPLGKPPAASGSRLFLAGGKSVIRWNPQTDERQILLPPFDIGSRWDYSIPWQRFPPYE